MAKRKKSLVLFKLENRIPLPHRGDSEEVRLIKEKVSNLVINMKIGQSFVIPFTKLHTVQKYLKTNCSQFSFRACRIKDNKAFARIWRRA